MPHETAGTRSSDEEPAHVRLMRQHELVDYGDAAALNLDFGENLRVVLSAEGLLDQAVEYNAPSTIFVQLNLDF